MPITPQALIGGRRASFARHVDLVISKEWNWCSRKIKGEARTILEHLNHVWVLPILHFIDRSAYGPHWDFPIIHQRLDGSRNRLRANERQISLNVDEPVCCFELPCDFRQPVGAAGVILRGPYDIAAKLFDGFLDSPIVGGDDDLIQQLRLGSIFINVLNHGLAADNRQRLTW